MVVSEVTTIADGCPVTELLDRYQIKRTALHERMTKLGIKSVRIKGLPHRIITAEQLSRLDEYDRQLSLGATSAMSTERPERGEQVSSIDLLTVLPAVMQMLTDRASRDLMANYRQLQEASDRGWFLPTSLVRELIGVTPHGARFDRCGFRFEPAAKYRSTEWRVSNIT
jgi:hypothetical protein